MGNRPTSEAVLWSALSLIALLAGIALVLFAFGKFSFLGWHGERAHVHPHMLPGTTTASQRATIKYFVLVALLFFAQVLVGGATAHYRADPGSFYGIDISGLLPSHLVRTWHLQLAIFWVATAYVAGGLFLAPTVGGREPAGQVTGVNVLFSALVLVVVGSLLGEWLGIHRLLGDLWFWVGHQGWEFLDLGRAWQILLAVGLVLWIGLLWRGIAPARQDPERREVASLFLYAALAIPVFYLPAMFFDSSSHFSVVDTWRFWIIHLWVEGFFELFATVMVAVIFSQLGLVSQLTAARVVYLGDFQKRCSQALLPPAGGGEVGGSGAGRGTLARSVCLCFPLQPVLRHCVGAARFALPPAGGRPRSRDLAPRAPAGCSFAEIALDAILYLGSGIIGTGHHWYWTGQAPITMALAATFSALEVVPLTLLTLDAWDFVKLTRAQCDVCGQAVAIPHKWTFYFLMAVGFWNFVGAGVFGFLINLPIVSYFEVGTIENHGHTAMMGVFGMLAMALLVFALRRP